MSNVIKTCVLQVALAIVATTSSSAAQNVIEGGLGEPTIGFKREPTLIYDVSGPTILGPVHSSLVVYNDGFVTYSSLEVGTTQPQNFIHKLIPDVIVKRLTNDLLFAGIMDIQDSLSMAADLPITTVTYMRPQINANAHTYSHDSSNVGQIAVVFIISEFLNDWVLAGNDTSAVSFSADAAESSAALIASNEFKQEPVLAYSYDGVGLLTGPITRSIVVYNNGLVSVAEEVPFFSELNVYFVFETPGAVRDLNANLAKAGAGMLPDGTLTGTDGFRVTVTYFRGGTNARAHTFSFLEGDPNLAYINVALQVGFFTNEIANPFLK